MFRFNVIVLTHDKCWKIKLIGLWTVTERQLFTNVNSFTEFKFISSKISNRKQWIATASNCMDFPWIPKSPQLYFMRCISHEYLNENKTFSSSRCIQTIVWCLSTSKNEIPLYERTLNMLNSVWNSI